MWRDGSVKWKQKTLTPYAIFIHAQSPFLLSFLLVFFCFASTIYLIQSAENSGLPITTAYQLSVIGNPLFELSYNDIFSFFGFVVPQACHTLCNATYILCNPSNCLCGHESESPVWNQADILTMKNILSLTEMHNVKDLNDKSRTLINYCNMNAKNKIATKKFDKLWTKGRSSFSCRCEVLLSSYRCLAANNTGNRSSSNTGPTPRIPWVPWSRQRHRSASARNNRTTLHHSTDHCTSSHPCGGSIRYSRILPGVMHCTYRHHRPKFVSENGVVEIQVALPEATNHDFGCCCLRASP